MAISDSWIPGELQDALRELGTEQAKLAGLPRDPRWDANLLRVFAPGMMATFDQFGIAETVVVGGPQLVLKSWMVAKWATLTAETATAIAA